MSTQEEFSKWADEVLDWAAELAEQIEELHLVAESLSPFEGMHNISFLYNNGVHQGLFIWFTKEEKESAIQRDSLDFYYRMHGTKFSNVLVWGGAEFAISAIKEYLQVNNIKIQIH